MPTETDSIWFIFHNGMLLVKTNETGLAALPRAASMPFPEAFPEEGKGKTAHFLGELAARPCYAVDLAVAPAVDPARFEFTSLRSTYDILGEGPYTLAGKGAELIHWDRLSKYCPACGKLNETASPLCKKCPGCGNETFPNISVATIVLVRKGDAALLVRSRNNPRNTHGLVAGFLETGENLEECVAREVKEETGLDIANITYFGSQPWPYPCGLMVGFTADYKSGEIVVQEEELASAAFFTRDDPPNLPHRLSIARRLIDSWLEPETAPAGIATFAKTGD